MRLTDLQQALQASVLDGATAAQQLIRSTPQFDARARLRVYQHAYPERLVGALAVTYPALHGVLGESKFRQLARAFVTRVPSRHRSIRDYGRELDAFIGTELTGNKAAVLVELARWEWHLAAAFDAADAEPVTTAALAAIDPTTWGQLRFRLAPSLQRLTFASNAVQWWRFATQKSSRPTRWRLTAPKAWALWRSDLSTYFRSLPIDEAHALDVVAAGAAFDAVCEDLFQRHGDAAPARAATLLQQWLRDGWIVELRA